MIRNVLVIMVICFSANLNKVFAQMEEPVFRFGLMADIQYADAESGGSRFYRNSLKKAKEAVDSLNCRKVKFTINLGDVTDRNFEDLDSILFYLGHLKHKLFNTTGNHDYKGVKDNQLLYKKLGMPSEYYFFKKKNWAFILLNTNEIAYYSNIAGTEKEQELTNLSEQIRLTGGIQGARWNGGISSEQLEWLDRLLEKCRKSGKKVLIFTHHPLYPETAFVALNYMEILNVISKYDCVKAIFCGHHHTGGFAYYKDIPVVTVEGMIETEDKNAYGIVGIYKDKIVLEGKGRMTSRELKLR